MYTNVITSHWKGSVFEPITECMSLIRSHCVTWQSLEGRSWIVTGVGGLTLFLCRCWFDDLVCIWKREIVALVDSHMFFPVSYRNVAGGAEFFWLKRLIGGGGKVGAILGKNRVFV